MDSLPDYSILESFVICRPRRIDVEIGMYRLRTVNSRSTSILQRVLIGNARALVTDNLGDLISVAHV